MKLVSGARDGARRLTTGVSLIGGEARWATTVPVRAATAAVAPAEADDGARAYRIGDRARAFARPCPVRGRGAGGGATIRSGIRIF